MSDVTTRVSVVLFDRDGTLVVDVPYNGDPDAVVLMPGVKQAVSVLKEAGVSMGVISNQSGIARGSISIEQVESVNARVGELIPELDVFFYCPHGVDDGCQCRKPQPKMVHDGAAHFGVDSSAVAVIGDIAADVQAAAAAGARGILVPTATTRPEEVDQASEVASNIHEAALKLLGRM